MSFDITNLGEYATVQGGYAYKSQDFKSSGEWSVLKIKNVRNGHVSYEDTVFVSSEVATVSSKWATKSGDILISMTGSGPSAPESLVGRVARVWKGEKPALINQRVGRITLKENSNIDQDFLFYLLSLKETQDFLVSNATGSANQVNISAKTIESVPCPKLDHGTSAGIASILLSLDAKIRLLRETNATLEAIAQAMFKSWFVDFDPVHAKQQGLAPEGMDEATAALFPDSFEESELGLVPKGWIRKSLSDISEILNGFAFKSEDYVAKDSGVFVLRTTNFSDDGYSERLNTDVFLPPSFLQSHAKFICEPFDFHLVMVGASVGRTSTLLPHMLPALRNQNMWCFRAKRGFPSKFYIHETVKLKVIEALRSTSGSAREFLRKGDFEKNKILLAPDEMLLDFEGKVSVLKNKIAVNENQSDLLMKIRDTLLPRLISGQLRLPEVEAVLEEATA